MKIMKNAMVCLLIIGMVFSGTGPFTALQVNALSVSSYNVDTKGLHLP
jgi:hypothetical protein